MVNYPAVSCPAGYTCTANSGVVSLPTIQQGSSFTHAYSDARTYKVTFTVRNNLGLSTQSTATVKVTNSNASPLNIISPNGGEVWQKGSMQAVTWNAPAYFRATYADIMLIPYMAPCNTSAPCPMYKVMTYPIAKGISINQNSFTWKVGDYIPEVMTMIYPPVYPTVPDGQYTAQICEVGGGNCDTSNRPFTISTTDSPKVVTPNGGETWLSNSAQLLRWTTSNGLSSNTRLDLYLDQTGIYCIKAPCGSTYILDKNIPITMAYNWVVATDMNNVKIPDGSYNFRVCIAGSTTNCDSSDQSFKIISTVAVPDVNIVSPNGGQTYKIGSQVPITWKLDGTIKPEYYVWLRLGEGGTNGAIAVLKATDPSAYTWTIPSAVVMGDVIGDLSPGSYKVHIGLYDGPVCTGFCAPGNYGKLIAYDDSDSYITITR
jgi:PKD repeat protein